MKIKKGILVFSMGFLAIAVFFLRYEIGRAGDLPNLPEATPPVAASIPASVQAVKGSGKFVSMEPRETGEFLLSVQDEFETEKKYLIPKGLTVRKGEEAVRPSQLQPGDILDIDYLLSETGERVASYVSLTIPAKDKEIRVEAPVLESKPKETP